MWNKENTNNINLDNSNLEHTPRLHNETLEVKHKDEDIEELNEEIAEKFYFHQLFDIGDILGFWGVVILLKLFKKDPINSIPNSTFYIFIGELIVELVLEWIFSLILSPIVRKVTDMKNFEPSRSARKTITTNAVSYSLILYRYTSVSYQQSLIPWFFIVSYQLAT